MAKSNQIKKVVNGEIADADDVNQIVEDAGNEGGGIPYDPTSHQRSTDGSQSLGSVTYPWGSLKINQNAELVEVDPTSPSAAASVAIKNLRKFIYLKDAPSSYTGKGNQKVSVKSDESGLEFTAPSGIPTNIQRFTSSGTWTRPAGIDTVYVIVRGAGGGGGGASTNGSFGTPGGGGGYSEGRVTVTADVTVTVGAGGAAGTGSGDGVDGGASSFAGSTTPTGNGGKKGLGNQTGVVAGGAGGTAANGTINISGEAGGTSIANFTGRAGGSYKSGSGGDGTSANASGLGGQSGFFPGAGGGGGNRSTSSNSDGGAGADGEVIVIY